MMSGDKAPAITGDWKCTTCGSVEEGLETQRPARCLECGAPATALVFVSAADDRWEEFDDEEDLTGDDLDEDEGLYDDFDEDEPLEDDEAY